MKKVLSIILCAVIAVSCLFFSVSAKTVNVSAPKIKSVINTDIDRQKIKWTKVSGVKGYQLYCKAGSGKYKKIKTLGKNTTSFINKKLKIGKKYFYKIRSYKKVKGKTKYSKFSAQKGKNTTNYLMNLVQPYSTNYQYDDFTAPNSVELCGKKYTNGFSLSDDGYSYFNLSGKYSKITFISGAMHSFDCEYSIIADDYVVKTIYLKANDLPKKYTVDIENANKLQFLASKGWWSGAAIVEIKVYK